MKVPVFAIVALFVLSGCATRYERYGPSKDGVAPAQLYLLGHKAEPPIAAMLKLQSIGTDAVWNGSVTAYELAPDNYDLRYRWASGAGNAYRFRFGWGVHPYKIQARLKSGYVYAPVLQDESAPPQEVCLYGEPIGTPGQRTVSTLLFLSKNAERVACGSIDRTITYESN